MDQLESLILVGVLFGTGLWGLLDGRVLRAVVGLVLLSNGVNLFLLMMAGDPRDKGAPLIREGVTLEPVDPLPQALILTAIVIGFAILAYAVFLLARSHTEAAQEERDA